MKKKHVTGNGWWKAHVAITCTTNGKESSGIWCQEADCSMSGKWNHSFSMFYFISIPYEVYPSIVLNFKCFWWLILITCFMLISCENPSLYTFVEITCNPPFPPLLFHSPEFYMLELALSSSFLFAHIIPQISYPFSVAYTNSCFSEVLYLFSVDHIIS